MRHGRLLFILAVLHMLASCCTDVTTLTVDGFKREYRLFVPPAALDANPPLIIVLHGTYGTGKKMQRGLGFDRHARQHGFIVAYPDAYRTGRRRQTTRWNDGRGVLESSELGIDDVAFIAAMIDDIAARYPIDRKRVFATGASNGGIMSYRLGCELHGLIRAIAPVMGNVAEPLNEECWPDQGLSILSINGDADPYIPLNGGLVCQGVSDRFCEGGTVLSRNTSAEKFSAANACDSTPVSTWRPAAVSDGTWVEELTYQSCTGNAKVQSLVVHGMGHVWPPRSGQVKGSGPPSQNLDATNEIVSFFLGFD